MSIFTDNKVIKSDTIMSKNGITFFPKTKTCPKCHGSGTSSPMFMVDLPGITDQSSRPRPNKNNPSSLFKCKECGGKGVIPDYVIL